ncbi:MAG: ferredoxin--NADP reductase [Acidobacteriota bacterium]
MALPEPNAVIALRREVAPGLLVIRVVPSGWPLPDFTPGQFAVLGLPPSAPRCENAEPEEEPPRSGLLLRRAYSIASSSRAREYVEFFVALVRSGAFTPRLWALREGDPLWLSPRFTGMFTLAEVPPGSDLVLVATGTGLAPYLSMLRSGVAAGVGRRIAVIHGARHSWDLAYRSELAALERSEPRFAYLPVVSRPLEETPPWSAASGYVQDVWSGPLLEARLGRRPSPRDTHVFLCGNPAMVDDMVERLGAEGFREHSRKSPGQIHVERYW